jgi:hypothetical protein
MNLIGMLLLGNSISGVHSHQSYQVGKHHHHEGGQEEESLNIEAAYFEVLSIH